MRWLVYKWLVNMKSILWERVLFFYKVGSARGRYFRPACMFMKITKTPPEKPLEQGHVGF